MSATKYNNDAARRPDQLDRMKDLASRGVCAFCPEHIARETTTEIEIETANWIVKANDYPYEHTKLHLLVIPKAHVATISQLSKEAQQEFLPLITEIEKRYQLASYSLGLRSGDMRYNGGSVEHMHAHVIVGDPDHSSEEPVRFKMSSRPKQ